MKRIDVITGSRAEWGLLERLVKRIAKSHSVRLIVTGSHLSPAHGMTVDEIDFGPCPQVEIVLSSDTPAGVCKSVGLAFHSAADIFSNSRPDVFLCLGDRYETFAFATAAHINRIPICHLHGGEVSGNYDNAFRHAISHMASLHLVAGIDPHWRLRFMGIPKKSIHIVGALGLDGLRPVPYSERTMLDTVLVVYHPVTDGDEKIGALLWALRKRPEKKVFIGANQDNGGAEINKAIQEFVRHDTNARFYQHLPRPDFLRILAHCKAIIGNSSAERAINEYLGAL